MTIKHLSWQETQPDLDQLSALLEESSCDVDFFTLQPRLKSVLSLLCPEVRKSYHAPFMLLKSAESPLFLSLLRDAVSPFVSPNQSGFAYHIYNQKVSLIQSDNQQDNFSPTDRCLFSSSTCHEELFGCVRRPDDDHFKLQAGLVHKANGGVLVLGLRTLLSQPNLWSRLKKMVMTRQYEWFAPDDADPLPISIPPIPLDLRIILVGDRLSMADLQEYEPEFYHSALYAEFENELFIHSTDEKVKWAAYVKFLAQYQQLPPLDTSALKALMKMGMKQCEDQHILPLSPDWLSTRLMRSAHVANQIIDEAAVITAVEQKEWQESYLIERFRSSIFTQQVTINTQDHVVGQINGLSVVEYPGHPTMIGEPTRLSCLIHFGDGEFVDIERKNDLAGNIHAKGMMIMQSFINSEFATIHPLPFSASLVFEQSYNEVDGDSASLAGLCALMSALSAQAIDQQIAVTGAVDQFGNVQSIGCVNEKIAGFFAVCKHQGLTGSQGVIIPHSNYRHLCLNDDIVDAIKNEKFHIWTVEHVEDALYLLTGIPYQDDNAISLYKLIQARIQMTMNRERYKVKWWNKWCK